MCTTRPRRHARIVGRYTLSWWRDDKPGKEREGVNVMCIQASSMEAVPGTPGTDDHSASRPLPAHDARDFVVAVTKGDKQIAGIR